MRFNSRDWFWLRQPIRIRKPTASSPSPPSMMKWRKSGKRMAASCWVRSHGVMNCRWPPSFSSDSTYSISLLMVGRRRTRANVRDGELAAKLAAVMGPSYGNSDVDLHGVAMQFHQLAARRCFALAHELGDQVFGLQEVRRAQFHHQQA